MNCRDCMFWTPRPDIAPRGWGKCERLSGDASMTLLADARGEEIQHVSTPPSFGCNQAAPALTATEHILVHCRVCEQQLGDPLDPGRSEEAQARMEEHLRDAHGRASAGTPCGREETG